MRKIFNCFSLTAVAFVFQACYGMEPDRCYDVKLTGTVTSKTTDLPIHGIKISVGEGYNYGFTDKNGNYAFYATVCGYWDETTQTYSEKVNVDFLDIDGILNGHFADKTIVIEPASKNEVRINVQLEEKE